MKSDERRPKILECIINQYIHTGEPVGSNTIAAMLGHSVSAATIRNDMATLERLGLLEQPHTSAGRIPTYHGYRLYINQLMQVKPLIEDEKKRLDDMISENADSVSSVIDHAFSALAEITECAVISKINLPKFSVITKVEVIPAGRRLYVILLITSTGDIKNKVCRVKFDLTNEQIAFFENIVNHKLSGIRLEDLSPKVIQNLSIALGSYIISLSPLLYTLYQLSDEMAQENISIKGEHYLLSYDDFDANELLRFMKTQKELENILQSAMNGIHVIFGNETGSFAVTNSSFVLSKQKNENLIDSFGLIGPIRLDYSKIIPYVKYFSKSLNKIIEQMLEQSEGDDNDE